MIDNIVLGYIKDKNEANHESSMVKQIIYNMITLTAYLGWVNLCTVKPMVTLILMCNAPIWGVGYLNILFQDWPSTPWWSYQPRWALMELLPWWMSMDMSIMFLLMSTKMPWVLPGVSSLEQSFSTSCSTNSTLPCQRCHQQVMKTSKLMFVERFGTSRNAHVELLAMKVSCLCFWNIYCYWFWNFYIFVVEDDENIEIVVDTTGNDTGGDIAMVFILE